MPSNKSAAAPRAGIDVSSERFRVFFDKAPVAMLSVSRDGRMEAVNRRFVAEFGYTEEDLSTPDRWWELAYPDPRYRGSVKESWLSAVKRAREAGGEVTAGEYLVRRKDGTHGVYLIGANLVDDSVLVSFVDLSERKRAEGELRKAEATNRILLDASPAYYVAIGADGRVRSMNRVMLDSLEITEKEAIGLDYLSNFVPEQDRPMTAAVMDGIVRSKTPSINENHIVARSGKEYLIAWRGRPVYDKDDRLDFIAGVGIDVTEWKKAEKAARENEYRFKTLFEEAPLPLAMFSRDGTLLLFNRRFEALLGGYEAGRDNLETIWARTYPDPAVRQDVRRRWKEAATPGSRPFDAYESRIMNAEAEERVLLINTSVLDDEILVSFLDITERKRSEETLRTIIDAAPYSIVINRASDGVYQDVNDAYLEANGFEDRSDVIGKTTRQIARMVNPEDSERMAAALEKEGRIDNYQYGVYQGEQIRHQIVSARSIKYRGEDCFVSLIMDITALKEAEERLRILNAQLELKVAERTEDLDGANRELRAANEGLAKAMEELKTTQGQIVVSEKLAALGRLMAGIAHELNTPLAAIAASSRLELRNLGEGLEELAQAVSRLGPEELAFLREARLRTASQGGPVAARPAAERAARREVQAVLEASGVADARTLAADLVELGIGDMAGRSAALFAGPRGSDLLTLLRGAVGSYRAAWVAEEAIRRATRVVSALRTYARGGEDEEPTAIRLSPEIRTLLDLYYNRTKRGIEIDLRIPEDLEVFGRREALGRVWFNLLNNAVQAVGEAGRIEVHAAPGDGGNGGEVLISIADSGPGIPEQIRERIFEPFFTTKPAGEGTGLGLDIARRLVREHGGDISFESRPGRTVFTVRLPARVPVSRREP